nr:hypothetical protein [uncultured Mogibacterium sp.]
MTTIIDWLGKADDLTITYDAVMHQNNQITEGIVEEFSKQSDEMDKDQKKEIKTKVKVAKKSINSPTQPPVPVPTYGFVICLSHERRCPIWIKSKLGNS